MQGAAVADRASTLLTLTVSLLSIQRV